MKGLSFINSFSFKSNYLYLENKKNKNRKIENVFVIMNGPSTKKIDWEKINNEMKNNSKVIVCNGALGTGFLNDSKNLIFLACDPIMKLYIENNITSFNQKAEKLLMGLYPDFPKDTYKFIKFDISSIKKLFEHRDTLLATNYPHLKNKKISKKRQILFRTNFLSKLFLKIGYSWHQNGFEPSSFLKRYGIRTMPKHTRKYQLIYKNKFLRDFWYFINFNQTPNSFYRAIDIAINFQPKNIFFIGRNSQILDWALDKNIKENFSQEVFYEYFFTNDRDKITIKDKTSILREIYYSNQYMNMIREFFSEIRFISLEKNICFSEFYSENHANNYLK